MNSTNLQKKKIRQEKILYSLDKLGYASRSQLQRLHNLKSNRNACRVLKAMEEYLNSFRLEENVYYLNKKGREMIGSEIERKKTLQVDHFLMRNDAYIFFDQPKKWEIEFNPVRDSDLVPDAFFQHGGTYKFLEVDNTQKMTVNARKIEKYKKLTESSGLTSRLGYFPILVWVTTTEVRREKLKKLCEKHSVPAEVYTRKDLL